MGSEMCIRDRLLMLCRKEGNDLLLDSMLRARLRVRTCAWLVPLSALMCHFESVWSQNALNFIFGAFPGAHAHARTHACTHARARAHVHVCTRECVRARAPLGTHRR